MARPNTVHVPKPRDMFDRDWEWSELTAFVTGDQPGIGLGVVSGRRRQGKTFLLDKLVTATGGLFFGAEEVTEAESLRQLGAAIGRVTGSGEPARLDSWQQAVQALLHLGAEHPFTIVIDEFPYLVGASPALPSILQNAIGARTGPRLALRPRLLLCGSAMSFMGKLLSGSAPLRGRAGLELVVHPLGYRKAADFWGIQDSRLAVLTHAIVGGTPAYRREFVNDDAPASLEDFDDWVRRAVLNPARPLYREAPYLLAEETDLADRSLHHSVLAAVSLGNSTRGGIAGWMGRPSPDLDHPLTVLRDCGLLAVEPDAFRPERIRYRIAEPLLTFHHAVVRPIQDQLGRRQAATAWSRSKERFNSQVLGPHFEHLCREWVMDFAGTETFGGLPLEVSSGTVPDAERRISHELDVVVRGAVGQDTGILLSIGEAKWNKVMDLRHLERLRHVLTLLAARGEDISRTVPACYSAAGFTPDLRAAETRGEVVLVDLNRLYHGE